MTKVLIFCVERKQYWKSKQRGYTFKLSEAGLYDMADAVIILHDLNSDCEDARMIDIDEAFTSLQKQVEILLYRRCESDAKLDSVISLLNEIKDAV